MSVVLDALVHVVRPAAQTTSGRPPLLILLHGVGSNEQSMLPIASAIDPAFVVLSVRSPVVLGASSFGWFHVEFTPSGPVIDEDEARRGWQMLGVFVDAAVERYGADPARVFIGGFSQGAIMAMAALLTAPSKLAGAFAMSGRLLPELLPHVASARELTGKTLLIVHGVDDQKLGIHFARSARERLAALPVALSYHELPMGHTVTAESLAVVTSWLSTVLEAGASA